MLKYSRYVCFSLKRVLFKTCVVEECPAESEKRKTVVTSSSWASLTNLMVSKAKRIVRYLQLD